MRAKPKQLSFFQAAFWREHRSKFLSLFVLYEAIYLTIGSKDYAYIDDVYRQSTGTTDFAASYSRWGSELFSWIFQGSRHLTDLGNMSFFISGVVMTLASICLVYVILGDQFSYFAVIAASILGINPWALQMMSFRFDSPYMALSVLFSIVPFLFWSQKRSLFFGASLVGVFLMCNTYQPASGIYLGVYFTLVFHTIVFARGSWKKVMVNTLLAASAYSIALIGFFIESSLNPEIANRGNTVTVASPSEWLTIIPNNIQNYFHMVFDYSARSWQVLVIATIFILLLMVVRYARIAKLFAVGLMGVYLGLLFVFSYGVLLIFKDPLTLIMPRYNIGISIFLAGTFILVSHYVMQERVWRGLIVIPMALIFYLTSFSMTYATMLTYQKASFDEQSQRLINDLALAVPDHPVEVYISNMFKNSALLESACITYPVLEQLVPPNSDVSIFNRMMVERSSQMEITLVPFDFTNFDTATTTQVVSNYYWDIYVDADRVYVSMKR